MGFTVWPILSVSSGIRVPSFSMFMGLILPSIELGSGYYVRVIARLYLRFIISWADTEMMVRSPEHRTVLGLGLSVR